jgi:hypothetical protein
LAAQRKSLLRLDLRGMVLRATALGSSLGALAALLAPDLVAGAMGLFLVGVNGYSQFYAEHVGLRFAIAALAFLATRPGVSLLGEATGLLLLAHTFGRMVAAMAIGLPQGTLLIISVAEMVAGFLLLFLPSRSPSSESH